MGSAMVPKPVAIVIVEWKADPEFFAFTRAPQNYRDTALIPNKLVSLRLIHRLVTSRIPFVRLLHSRTLKTSVPRFTTTRLTWSPMSWTE